MIKDKRDITEGVLKEINALLLLGIKDTPAITANGEKVKKPATPGHYKKMPNHVLQANGKIHKYVEPTHVAAQMHQLCQWLNTAKKEKINPIIISAIAHYNFVRIHPFDDGNGRGARLLMNLILIAHKLSPAIIRNEDRREYFNLLTQADSGDLMPFIVYIAKQVIATQKTIISAIEDI